MSLHARGPKKILHSVIWANGRAIWESTGFPDTQKGRQKAKVFEAERIRRLLNGEYRQDKKGSMPWGVFTEKYLAYSKAEKSPATYYIDELVIRKFNSLMTGLGVRTLADFTPEAIDQFKNLRREKSPGILETTIWRNVSALKAMAQWAEDRGFIEDHPLRKVKNRQPQSRNLPPFNPEELDALREACIDDFERVLLEFAYYTGRRRREITRAQRSEIDFKNGLVLPADTQSRIKKQGVVPLHPKLAAILKEWFKRDFKTPYIFELHGRRLEDGYASEIMERLVKRVKLKGGLHKFRRTFGSRLLDKNVNQKKIQELMGHSNIQTTGIYTKVEIESTRRDLEESL